MAAQEKTWSELTRFSFSNFHIDELPPSEQLYANGLQQVRVGIELSIISEELADENGFAGPVTLSAKELASVRLVVYRGGAELPAQWKISDAPNDYHPFPEGARSASANTHRSSAPRGTYYPDRYVTTTAGPTDLKMALAITRDDGATFITDGNDDEYGLLDVSITLTPVVVPTYHLDNYSFDKTEQESNLDLFVHVYSLSARDNQSKPLRFIGTATVSPAGMIQWHDKVAGETHASYVGYAQPGQSAVTWNTSIVYGSHKPSAKVNQPNADRLAFVLVGRNDIPFHSSSAINHNGPLLATPRDQYGNPHPIRVRFKNTTAEGRLELIIEKA